VEVVSGRSFVGTTDEMTDLATGESLRVDAAFRRIVDDVGQAATGRPAVDGRLESRLQELGYL
jgi:hypothetical protein